MVRDEEDAAVLYVQALLRPLTTTTIVPYAPDLLLCEYLRRVLAPRAQPRRGRPSASPGAAPCALHQRRSTRARPAASLPPPLHRQTCR